MSSNSGPRSSDRPQRRPTLCWLRAGTLSVAAMLGCVGCQWVPPWKYNTPPTALSRAPSRHSAEKPIVVFGDFRNPVRAPLDWDDVGPGVSASLSQALRNQGNFEVWYNPSLAIAVQRILDGPTTRRTRRLEAIHRQHEDVRYVVTGSVTDFHHTREVPRDLRRREWWIFSTKKEAIVAIQFHVVDLNMQRVLISDHVYGVRDSGRKKAAELYADVAYDSYLFWNSPLGRATEEAISKAMVRFNEVVTGTGGTIRIARRLSPRRVKLSGAPISEEVMHGDFFVCRIDPTTTNLTTVNDVHTGEPLRARIVSSGRNGAVAWIRGEAPPEVDLRHAMLRRQPPQPATPPAAAEDEPLPEDDDLLLPEADDEPRQRSRPWWERLLSHKGR